MMGKIERIFEKDKEDDKKFKDLKNKVEEREKEECKKKEKLEKRIKALEEKLAKKEEGNVEEIKKVVKEKLESNDDSWANIVKERVRDAIEEKSESRNEDKETLERCEEELRKMKWQREKEERIRRRNNIIISGYKKNGHVTTDEIEKYVKDKLGVSV